jgi:hypothetical protein
VHCCMGRSFARVGCGVCFEALSCMNFWREEGNVCFTCLRDLFVQFS